MEVKWTVFTACQSTSNSQYHGRGYCQKKITYFSLKERLIGVCKNCCFMAACDTTVTHFISKHIFIFIILEEMRCDLTRTKGWWFIFIHSCFMNRKDQTILWHKRKNTGKLTQKSVFMALMCKFKVFSCNFGDTIELTSPDVRFSMYAHERVCVYVHIFTCVWPGIDRESHDLLPDTFNIHHQRQPVSPNCVGAQGHLYI